MSRWLIVACAAVATLTLPVTPIPAAAEARGGIIAVSFEGGARSSPMMHEPAQDDAELQRLREDFDVAVATFGSLLDQPDSIPMFARLITALERRLEASGAAADRDLLVDCLTYRSQALFNNGAEEEAAADIRALLRRDPAVEMDRVQLSPRYLNLFDDVYDATIGFLELDVRPADVQVRLDGALLAEGLFRYPVVAGSHALSLERPGFEPVQEEIEVGAGERLLVERSLVRLSAVLRVFTRPTGAAVAVDGRVLGSTAGQAPADFVPPPEAALYSRAEFSEALVVEGLQPGTHSVEVALPGYRTRLYDVQVADLADYRATIVLERAAGTVVLEGLEPEAEVMVDGVEATPQFPEGQGSPRLELEPGEHRIEISSGGGVFIAEVEVADQQTRVVPVLLRPGLALLGVLGGDERGARELAALLRSTLATVEDWTVLDRTWAEPLFDDVGLSSEALRAAAVAGAGGPDWRAVQAAFDREARGSVYLLAVLDDDLVATGADLWIWPSAPGPARPDRVRVRLDSAADIVALAGGFEAATLLEGPWLGGLLADVGGGVTVIDVTAGGPAAAAGIQVGDRVVSIAGELIDRAAAARAAVRAAAPGAVLAIQVQRDGATQIFEVMLGATPTVISPADPELLYSVISATLAAGAPASETGEWIVELNRAAVLLHAAAWEEAVRTLRAIDGAPSGAGLGQGAVDYWLGIALTALGPAYREQAAAAFRGAAADPDARLFDNDGPWVAPRAAARLAALGG
ncbi:MAG TPA: PDZ domain-containing protein [Acidobacteriota bacterium]